MLLTVIGVIKMPGTNIFPIKIQEEDGQKIITREEIYEQTMKEIGLTEADLEEFVRKNVEILFPDGEETLLIIGQQVRNKAAGRADLVGIDGKGNIVLIELKRDKNDISQRKEAFEFQAIRYAANYALIKTQQDIVQKLFAPYIERHQEEAEFKQSLDNGLTASEKATRMLAKFLEDNQAQETLNRHQCIILIASSFDDQTLSACAWLAQNNINIRCIAISPIQYEKQYFFQVEQVIPPLKIEEYYVEIAEPKTSNSSSTSGIAIQPKKKLPRMIDILSWKLVDPGDSLYIKDNEREIATVIDDTYVKYQNQKMTYNNWGKKIKRWSAINIYEWVIHQPTNKTLHTLRREKLEELSQITPTETI